ERRDEHIGPRCTARSREKADGVANDAGIRHAGQKVVAELLGRHALPSEEGDDELAGLHTGVQTGGGFFHESQYATSRTGRRRASPQRPSGYPTGIMAHVVTSSGMPRTSRTSASLRRCTVVNVVPSPRARAARKRFCTAPKTDESP